MKITFAISLFILLVTNAWSINALCKMEVIDTAIGFYKEDIPPIEGSQWIGLDLAEGKLSKYTLKWEAREIEIDAEMAKKFHPQGDNKYLFSGIPDLKEGVYKTYDYTSMEIGLRKNCRFGKNGDYLSINSTSPENVTDKVAKLEMNLGRKTILVDANIHPMENYSGKIENLFDINHDEIPDLVLSLSTDRADVRYFYISQKRGNKVTFLKMNLPSIAGC